MSKSFCSAKRQVSPKPRSELGVKHLPNVERNDNRHAADLIHVSTGARKQQQRPALHRQRGHDPHARFRRSGYEVQKLASGIAASSPRRHSELSNSRNLFCSANAGTWTSRNPSNSPKAGKTVYRSTGPSPGLNSIVPQAATSSSFPNPATPTSPTSPSAAQAGTTG